jgi:hypothetical protein
VQQIQRGFIRILKGPTGGLLASLALAAFLGGVALAAPGMTPTPLAEAGRHEGTDVAAGGDGQLAAADGVSHAHRVSGLDVSSEVRSGVLPAPPSDPHAAGEPDAVDSGGGSGEGPQASGQGRGGTGTSDGRGAPGDGHNVSTPPGADGDGGGHHGGANTGDKGGNGGGDNSGSGGSGSGAGGTDGNPGLGGNAGDGGGSRQHGGRDSSHGGDVVPTAERRRPAH